MTLLGAIVVLLLVRFRPAFLQTLQLAQRLAHLEETIRSLRRDWGAERGPEAEGEMEETRGLWGSIRRWSRRWSHRGPFGGANAGNNATAGQQRPASIEINVYANYYFVTMPAIEITLFHVISKIA